MDPKDPYESLRVGMPRNAGGVPGTAAISAAPEGPKRMEMVMPDFAARVGESVRTARELRRQRAEAVRREEEDAARRLKESQEQASALVATTWERIFTASQASDGALTAERSEREGVTVFELRWQEDHPARALQISVDWEDGMIRAAWVVAPGYGRSVDAPTVATSGFEISSVESVIMLLVDQPRWTNGAIPSIP
jgi:hypothetical protein